MNLREWALPVYTVLTQLAVGALLIFWVLRSRLYSHYKSEELDRVSRVPLSIIFLTVCIAVVGAHFHLSKPYLSILAVRNFAHSWLSREIVFTVALFLTMAILTALEWLAPGRQTLKGALGWVAILFGLATVYCMGRIYMLPTQIIWNTTAEMFSDYGETLLLGGVALSAILLMDLNFSYDQNPGSAKIHERVIAKALRLVGAISLAALILTLAFDIAQVTSLCVDCDESARTSMQLLFGLYQPLFVLRLSLSVLGVVWLLLSLWNALRKKVSVRQLISSTYFASSMVLVGEVLGRYLFYATHVRIGI
jgi:anaerobic dimethyl sulfoxide reductase subunit C (anchor subunit)